MDLCDLPAHELTARLKAGAVTAADIAAIPQGELEDSLFVVRGKALLINLAKAKTPADWLRIPRDTPE